jgi:hypothetical protein
VLQNPRRRAVLRYLAGESPTTQGELAEHIAGLENDVDPAAVSSTQRKRVYISLYQSHLPKLDEAGAIDFDRNRGTVEATPQTDEFLSYVARVRDPEPNRDEQHATINLSAGTALAGVGLGTLLGASGAVPGLVAGVVALAAGVGAVALYALGG